MACEGAYDFKEVLKVIHKLAVMELFFDEDKISQDDLVFKIGHVRQSTLVFACLKVFCLHTGW